MKPYFKLRRQMYCSKR